METEKITNLLNDSSSEKSKFAKKNVTTRKNSIKLETERIKSSLWDYSDVFILVTKDITVNSGNDTDVAFKNFAPFSICKTEINDVFIDEANRIYIAIPM